MEIEPPPSIEKKGSFTNTYAVDEKAWQKMAGFPKMVYESGIDKVFAVIACGLVGYWVS